MLSWSEILIRLALASLFGALIGLERERKNWTAGLRTHMMVCVGSCLIMIVSAYAFFDILGSKNVVLDPSRIAAQVVSGIGFIGAGTILFSKQGTVHGLTTAAGLWTVAAIGLATGGGMYFAASATTVIALIILWALHPLEYNYSKKFRRRTLRITTDSNVANIELLKNLLSKDEVKVETFSLEKNDGELIFQVKFENLGQSEIDALMNELKNNTSIKEFSWIK
ncbi:MAG: magnesium transporter MgtC [Sphingobacteriales bacterium UTBCD1]|jgi:putative Mg2+ transporter-C (MgtC) family protein|nr:MAG: magnesium transporter MgtC [Sphingobacteriales bacterium UTBCD1]